MRILFDTNILIDHLNGVAAATKEIKSTPDPAISVITWIEVLAGAATPDHEMVLRTFLFNFECLPVSQPVADRTAAIRRTKKLKLPDAVIQATAETTGRLLCTRNIRDFPSGAPGVWTPYTL